MEQVLSRWVVGREAELRRLDVVVAAALDGSGGGLVLLGEAGIGKSRPSGSGCSRWPGERVA